MGGDRFESNQRLLDSPKHSSCRTRTSLETLLEFYCGSAFADQSSVLFVSRWAQELSDCHQEGGRLSTTSRIEGLCKGYADGCRLMPVRCLLSNGEVRTSRQLEFLWTLFFSRGNLDSHPSFMQE